MKKSTYEQVIEQHGCRRHVWGLRLPNSDVVFGQTIARGKTISMYACQLIEYVGPIDGFEWVPRDISADSDLEVVCNSVASLVEILSGNPDIHNDPDCPEFFSALEN